MESAMKRMGILLLAVCAVLAAGSAVSGLARAASQTVGERFETLEAEETPTPSVFVYLPLVMTNWGVGGWSTVVEEGFESEPSSLWTFEDWDGAQNGTYYWARRDCKPCAGNYSAWAVGGGADGASLTCGSPYPNNVDSFMYYGPFSLKNATAASLSFQLWMNVDPEIYDTLCIYAKSAEYDPWNGVCLTYQPDDWAPVTVPLDYDTLGIDILGADTVWVALDFVTDAETTDAEGAYVDDFVIRKCSGGLCQSTAGAGLSATPLRKVQSVRIGPVHRLPADQRLLK
jgi:hypothetical protein